MRIERIRKEQLPGAVRISANITWEEHDAPASTVFIETTEEFGEDIVPSADAFLAAMLPLAQWRGEKRVRVEGSICCRLRDGLAMATQVFGSWYERCGPIRIEPTHGFVPTASRLPRRTASFLSGGVDALALLRSNRLDYPADHPGYIRDCIVVFGLNTHDSDASGFRPERQAVFDALVQRLTPFVENAGATLVPMTTNIRGFYPDFATWGAVGFGPGILSTALCMGRRFDSVQIASVGLGVGCPPGGTHPLVDGQFSTEAVQVYHAQPGLTRMEKVRIVADWPEALSILRSCFLHTIPEDGRINCGRCEKCVRTMLALLALGKLGAAKTFPFDDIDAAMLEPFEIERDDARQYYEQCIGALDAVGRVDLTVPLRRKIDAYMGSKANP